MLLTVNRTRERKEFGEFNENSPITISILGYYHFWCAIEIMSRRWSEAEDCEAAFRRGETKFPLNLFSPLISSGKHCSAIAASFSAFNQHWANETLSGSKRLFFHRKGGKVNVEARTKFIFQQSISSASRCHFCCLSEFIPSLLFSITWQFIRIFPFNIQLLGWTERKETSNLNSTNIMRARSTLQKSLPSLFFFWVRKKRDYGRATERRDKAQKIFPYDPTGSQWPKKNDGWKIAAVIMKQEWIWVDVCLR